jgi:hypothetical protein
VQLSLYPLLGYACQLARDRLGQGVVASVSVEEQDAMDLESGFEIILLG